jgi:predicted amidophosphoribosyltransferase
MLEPMSPSTCSPRGLASRALSRLARALASLSPCAACGAAPATACSLCPACLAQPRVARREGDVLRLGPYAGPLGAAVRAGKYGGALRVFDELGAALGRGLARASMEDERLRAASLVPVPSHRRRRARRGPDPSERLAHAAAAAAGGRTIVAALERVRAAAPQSTLPAGARERNVAGAFSVAARWRSALRGRAVVLVDDVLTSGATTRACEAALAEAGATVVLLMVVAAPD